MPSLLTCSCSWSRLPRAFSAVVLLLAAVVLIPVSASLRGSLAQSSFLPPSPTLFPPSFLGPLWPLAPPRTPLPPDPATNIARRDKDVGDRMGRVVARWSVAGGSAPHGKSSSRPLAVVGGGIRCPRFLHRPQQYHPVHCRLALQHLHTRADGPAVDQVKC